MKKSDDCGKTWAVGLRHRSAENQTESCWAKHERHVFSLWFQNIVSFLFVFPSQYAYVLIPSWSSWNRIECRETPSFLWFAFEAEISCNHTHQQKREKHQKRWEHNSIHIQRPAHHVSELSSRMLPWVRWTEKNNRSTCDKNVLNLNN